MIDQIPSPQPKSRFLTPYVAVWALLAGGALVYLAVLVLKPEAMAQYWPSSPPAGTPETNEGQRATAADALAEVRALRDTVGQMQDDVAKLKTDVAAQSSLAEGWETRIAALETKPEPAPVVAEAPPEKSANNLKTVAAKKDKPAKAEKGAAPTVQAATTILPTAGTTLVTAPSPGAAAGPFLEPAPAEAAPAKPAAQPSSKAAAGKSAEMKVINAPAGEAASPKSLETGSVEAPAVTFGPGVVTSGPKPVGVVIATGQSLDSLRLSWSLLSDRHATALGAFQPRYTSGVDANGLTYDLVAGPVKSSAEAKKLCKDLAAKAITCRVTDYAGEAL